MFDKYTSNKAFPVTYKMLTYVNVHSFIMLYFKTMLIICVEYDSREIAY